MTIKDHKNRRNEPGLVSLSQARSSSQLSFILYFASLFIARTETLLVKNSNKSYTKVEKKLHTQLVRFNNRNKVLLRINGNLDI